MSYFFGKAKGVKADIERHRQHEKELQRKIEETLKEPNSKWKEEKLRTYNNYYSKVKRK